MERKQQPGMWLIVLICFSLGTTAKTECSVEWLGLKIKMHTKMLEGTSEWCREHCPCPASGTISWWLWPAKGQVGVVASRRQAHLWFLMWRTIKSTTWTGQDGGREHFSRREEEMWGTGCRGVGMLVIVGWFTPPGLVSDMHNLYISRTVISNRNQQVKCPN